MRILAALSGSLLSLALTLSGCGSGGSDRPRAGASASGRTAEVTVDACKLVTPADLAAAFGGSFDDGELSHQEQTGADQCAWKSTDDSSDKTFSITVLSPVGLAGALQSSGMSVRQLFEQTKTAYPNARALHLGDEAYAAVSEVQVLDKGTWYSITAYLGAGVNALGGLEKLATQVVGGS